MRRLVIAALALLAVCAVAGTALAGIKSSTIYNSTAPNGGPTNLPSYGPEAYSFKTIGDQINFAGTARTLSSATVTMSSWACQTGSWNSNCITEAGATFSQEITLNIFDAATYTAGLSTPIATSTKTFEIPYRPSTSPKCLDLVSPDGAIRPDGWYSPSSKSCKNGLANDVTFNFSNVTLPDAVVYEISYDTNNYGPNPRHEAGPYDSLNVAINPTPSVGTSTDPHIWEDGTPNPGFGNYTPAVQFKAGNGS
jgi:hypothetical protein